MDSSKKGQESHSQSQATKSTPQLFVDSGVVKRTAPTIVEMPSAEKNKTAASTQQPRPASKEGVSPGPKRKIRNGKTKASVPRAPIKDRYRSPMWNHFAKQDLVDGQDPNERLAQCNYCKDYFPCGSRSYGTGTLHQHLGVCTKYKRHLAQNDSSQPKWVVSAENNNATLSKFNEKQIRDDIVHMIIVDELPFRFVEKKGFNRLMMHVEPRFKMPSRWTIMRDCVELFAELKHELMNDMAGNRICLTTDTWTSKQNMNYMVVTAHFIVAAWKLHKRIISFKPITDHKGVTIAKDIEDVMLEWKIEQVLTVTVDNASANDNALGLLKNRFRRIGTPAGTFVLKGDHLHMRCMAHIINLIVCAGMSEISEAIEKVRALVKFIRSSPQRERMFFEKVKQAKIGSAKKLQLDVPTRWNAMFSMLSIAEPYQKAFDDLVEEFSHRFELRNLSVDEWEEIRAFIFFLQLFEEVTTHISGSKYVTANIYFEDWSLIYSQIHENLVNENHYVAMMANKMKSKYDSYWGNIESINKLLFVAAVLDPRYKIYGLNIWLKDHIDHAVGDTFMKNLRDVIDKMFLEYTFAHGSSVSSNDASSSVDSCDIESETVASGMGNLRKRMLSTMHKKISKSRSMGDTKSEFEKYISEPPETFVSPFDILNWWKVNSSRFPILSLMAKDVLAIPITTVASESAFSTGGRVIDCFRTSLAPLTAEALICTQNWLNSEPVWVGDMEDEKDLELSHMIDNDLPKMMEELQLSKNKDDIGKNQ